MSDRTWQQTVDHLVDDHQSGSTTLLMATIEGVKTCLQGTDEVLTSDLLAQGLKQIQRAHSSLVVLHHFVKTILKSLEETGNPDELISVLDRYINYWSDCPRQIAYHLKPLLSKKSPNIMLHSNSGTIVEVVKNLLANGLLPEIIQTESRPICEGMEQAKKLAGFGTPITYIADAGIDLWMANADVVLLGADQVTAEHVVNKMGSTLMGFSAMHHKTPLYVLTDSRKFSELTSPISIQNPDELWENPPEGVSPVNQYFEHLPRTLVTQVITEQGYA